MGFLLLRSHHLSIDRRRLRTARSHPERQPPRSARSDSLCSIWPCEEPLSLREGRSPCMRCSPRRRCVQCRGRRRSGQIRVPCEGHAEKHGWRNSVPVPSDTGVRQMPEQTHSVLSVHTAASIPQQSGLTSSPICLRRLTWAEASPLATAASPPHAWGYRDQPSRRPLTKAFEQSRAMPKMTATPVTRTGTPYRITA